MLLIGSANRLERDVTTDQKRSLKEDTGDLQLSTGGRGYPEVELIQLPRELVERLLNYLIDYQDEGPPGAGWKSDNLKADINNLGDALGLPKSSRY
jgi:hypothetical protein